MMDWNDNNITDEMLAAYIEGNASEAEKTYIEMLMSDSPLLSEAIDVVKDCVNYMESFSDIPIENMFDMPHREEISSYDDFALLSYQTDLDNLLLNNELLDDIDINGIDDISYNLDNDLNVE